MSKIGIASDHAGYEMKEQVKAWLAEKGHTMVDFGCNSAQSADYADYAHPLANAVENKEVDFGVSFCGSGNGITMTLNKHQGIRAALCWNEEISALSRAHNDANVCSMPARFITFDTAKKIVEAFINTPFEGGRHKTRIDKMPVTGCK
ncbi:MAG TPA: ribose 5-phosphate isomerase B [Bacteroidales bacterium]|nr:ribose 5-phosphate isomerase B [Bacteroidales bacterium]